MNSCSDLDSSYSWFLVKNQPVFTPTMNNLKEEEEEEEEEADQYIPPIPGVLAQVESWLN
ncbi:hypothetical protein E2C01_070129 [Portunus trituberculatus]|uniref:Uncharacterized protein n=1 Tax=Portunus trituberculatus TaxID=210409 RepID=A0A5B7I0R7_PORTR|nr:hypothetical protein [Portunus trituberculatus]